MKNKNQHNRFYVLFALLLCFVLIGCSTNSTDNSSDPNDEKQPSDNNPEAVADEYGGTLKVVFGESMVNIGLPPLIRSRGDSLVTKAVYETLGRFNENGEVVPWLAESWEGDPSSNTIKIVLKQGIQFHDGTDFNAEAVKWNIELFRDKGRVEASAIESIDVVDNYSLQLNLSRWDNSIYDNLFAFNQMASPTAYEENGEEWLQDNPVGTGPFLFKEWIRDEKVVFERNPNYWVEGLPYLDAVEFYTITEPATAEAAMLGGEFDLYLLTSPLITNNLANSFMIEALENGMGAIGLSLAPDSEDASSPLADVDVRKAISYAIDREAIVDAVYYGYAEPVHQWAVQRANGFNPEVVGTPYDPDKAKELLDKAGYGNGFDLTISFANTPDLNQTYTAVQGFLAEVGINVHLNAVQAQQWQEMTSSEGDWEGLINSVFRISNDMIFDFNRSLAANSSHYRKTNLSEEAEALLAEAKTITNAEEYIALSQRLQKVIFDDHQASIPLVVTKMTLAQNGKVNDHGFLKTQLTEWTPETVYLTK